MPTDSQQLFVNCQDDSGSYVRTVSTVNVAANSTISTTYLLEVENTYFMTVEEEILNEPVVIEAHTGISKAVKIAISALPFALITILTLIGIIKCKKQEWDDVPQVD